MRYPSLGEGRSAGLSHGPARWSSGTGRSWPPRDLRTASPRRCVARVKWRTAPDTSARGASSQGHDPRVAIRGPMAREGDQMITRDNVTRLALAAALLVLAGIIGWAGLTRPNNNAPAVWLGAALVPLAAAALLRIRPSAGAVLAVVAALVGAVLGLLLQFCLFCPTVPPLTAEAIALFAGIGRRARPVGDRAPRPWPGLGRGRHPRRGHAAGEQLPRGRAHRRRCDRLVRDPAADGRSRDPRPSCSGLRSSSLRSSSAGCTGSPASQRPSNAPSLPPALSPSPAPSPVVVPAAFPHPSPVGLAATCRLGVTPTPVRRSVWSSRGHHRRRRSPARRRQL